MATEASLEVFVRNVSYDARENDLHLFFGQFGRIHRISLPRDRSGNVKGFAFVRFAKESDLLEFLLKIPSPCIHMGRYLDIRRNDGKISPQRVSYFNPYTQETEQVHLYPPTQCVVPRRDPRTTPSMTAKTSTTTTTTPSTRTTSSSTNSRQVRSLSHPLIQMNRRQVSQSPPFSHQIQTRTASPATIPLSPDALKRYSHSVLPNGFVKSKHGTRPMNCRTIYVGNIPFELTQEALKNHFEEVTGSGSVRQTRIVKQRGTNISRGFGYVEFFHTSSVDLAMTRHGSLIRGRSIKVDFADAFIPNLGSTSSASAAASSSSSSASRPIPATNQYLPPMALPPTSTSTATHTTVSATPTPTFGPIQGVSPIHHTQTHHHLSHHHHPQRTTTTHQVHSPPLSQYGSPQLPWSIPERPPAPQPSMTDQIRARVHERQAMRARNLRPVQNPVVFNQLNSSLTQMDLGGGSTRSSYRHHQHRVSHRPIELSSFLHQSIPSSNPLQTRSLAYVTGYRRDQSRSHSHEQSLPLTPQMRESWHPMIREEDEEDFEQKVQEQFRMSQSPPVFGPMGSDKDDDSKVMDRSLIRRTSYLVSSEESHENENDDSENESDDDGNDNDNANADGHDVDDPHTPPLPVIPNQVSSYRSPDHFIHPMVMDHHSHSNMTGIWHHCHHIHYHHHCPDSSRHPIPSYATTTATATTTGSASAIPFTPFGPCTPVIINHDDDDDDYRHDYPDESSLFKFNQGYPQIEIEKSTTLSASSPVGRAPKLSLRFDSTGSTFTLTG